MSDRFSNAFEMNDEYGDEVFRRINELYDDYIQEPDTREQNRDKCVKNKELIGEAVEEAGYHLINEEGPMPVFLVDSKGRLWDFFPLEPGRFMGQCENLDITFQFGVTSL